MLSQRLPGKALLPLAGRPVLQHVVERTRLTPGVEDVVVVTGEHPSNDPIKAWCRDHGVECFRGHDTDVLTRFIQAANRYGYDRILRVTADCPCVDPQVLQRLIDDAAGADYGVVVTGASNVIGNRYPDGYDAELLSNDALEFANRKTPLVLREHVTRALWNDGNLNAVSSVAVWHPTGDLGHVRLTMDTPEDYDRLLGVFGALWTAQRAFTLDQVMEAF